MCLNLFPQVQSVEYQCYICTKEKKTKNKDTVLYMHISVVRGMYGKGT